MRNPDAWLPNPILRRYSIVVLLSPVVICRYRSNGTLSVFLQQRGLLGRYPYERLRQWNFISRFIVVAVFGLGDFHCLDSAFGTACSSPLLHLLDAILMARMTLCQLPSTVAMAVAGISFQVHRMVICSLPSVPSDRVASFFSNIDICSARPALRSRNCFRFSNSALFSLIRATRRGDGPDEDELPYPPDACREWEDSDRAELYMSARVVD